MVGPVIQATRRSDFEDGSRTATACSILETEKFGVQNQSVKSVFGFKSIIIDLIKNFVTSKRSKMLKEL